MRIYYLLIFLLLISCQKKEEKKPILIEGDEFFLAKALEQASKEDSIEVFTFKPFQVFKSGFLLNDSIKHGLHARWDSTKLGRMDLILFEFNENSYIRIDSIKNLESSAHQFRFDFHDFNFDSQTDFYTNSYTSNGHSQSSGYLFIVDPKTFKLDTVKNSLKLRNVWADGENKQLLATDFMGWSHNDKVEFGVDFYKWSEDELILMKSDTVISNSEDLDEEYYHLKEGWN